ncbi:hypothetical protein [Phenylobacterium sp.]|uniref:hypothetical protein n=1 Tax=Phenylobacterium sp. TaxID=1871053 RepID=UPI00391AD11F
MAEDRKEAPAERYLGLATQMRQQAMKTDDPEVAEGYLKLAAIWMQMAEDARARRPANDFPDANADDDAQREA